MASAKGCRAGGAIKQPLAPIYIQQKVVVLGGAYHKIVVPASSPTVVWYKLPFFGGGGGRETFFGQNLLIWRDNFSNPKLKVYRTQSQLDSLALTSTPYREFALGGC